MTRFIAAALLLATAPMALATRPVVDLKCVAFGMGPQLECIVRLRTADGQPLSGAAVTLGATMPSMPMAHQVKAEKAAPTGQPGEYRGHLTLEMSGAWAVQVDVNGPLRERVARTLQVDECDGDKRCPVPLAHAVSRAAAKPSRKP